MKLLPDVLLDPMRRSLRAALVSATACLALAPQAAGAADYIEPGAPSILPAPALSLAPEAGTFQFHLGAAGVFFHPESDFTLLGFPLPGADTDLSSNLTGSLEIEYFLSPNFSLAATVGIPPETDADGTGLLAPAGRLGKIHYGLGAAMAKYRFNGLGAFQPFVGGGLAYFHVFDTTDGMVANLDVDSAFGPVVQIGADYMFTPNIGVFASVSQAFMDTKGTGTFLLAPVVAKIDFDPTVVQAGLTVRF